MSANRRRHANTVPLLALARWILVAAFVCVAGLCYVHCKNQLHRSGAEIRKLEQELARISTACDVAQSKIAKLSSRSELQRKLASGFIKLQPITDDCIERFDQTASTVALDTQSAVQSVANPGGRP